VWISRFRYSLIISLAAALAAAAAAAAAAATSPFSPCAASSIDTGL
jgi:hypothetical protein